MKKQLTITALLIVLLAIGCSTKKKMAKDPLFGHTWELYYISGPKIAFEALYPKKIPQITFDKKTGKVMGNNGCNGYSADFTLEGDQLSFGEPGPTTMMYCGEGEQFFLRAMKDANRYEIDQDGNLNLYKGDAILMYFRKEGVQD